MRLTVWAKENVFKAPYVLYLLYCICLLIVDQIEDRLQRTGPLVSLREVLTERATWPNLHKAVGATAHRASLAGSEENTHAVRGC